MSMGNFLYEKVLPLLEYVPYALLIGVCVALLITLIYALVRTAQKKPVARGVRESLWGYFFIFPWVVGICIFFLSGVATLGTALSEFIPPRGADVLNVTVGAAVAFFGVRILLK